LQNKLGYHGKNFVVGPDIDLDVLSHTTDIMQRTLNANLEFGAGLYKGYDYFLYFLGLN
jgi:hypothetical protein